MKSATILHIPHASTEIPGKYLASFRQEVLAHELAVMTDWFCDELFDSGRDRLVFPVSRLVCDVERFRNDAAESMAAVGMGVTYRCTSNLEPLRTVAPEERCEILSQYYDPHHAAFADLAAKKLSAFGRCRIVDCHSFYPTALPYERCRAEVRPDFCIGTSDYHTPKAVSETLVRFLSAQGFLVMENTPFAGTIVPMRYFEKDARVHSVMIEVNRRLYMDAPGVKSADFPKIQSILRTCLDLIEEQLDG